MNSVFTAVRMDGAVSSLMKQELHGTIHSVFQSAVNLEVEGGIVTLLAPGRQLSPGGIQLDGWPDTVDHEMKTGDPAAMGGGQIAVGRIGSLWTVGLKEAKRVSLSVEQLTGLTQPPDYRQSLRILTRAIADSRTAKEGIAPVLCRMFPRDLVDYGMPQNVWCDFLYPRIQKLYLALCDRDVAACRLLGELVAGCGPGLTPSSDDFLAGIFAALYGASKVGILTAGEGSTLCEALARGALPKTGVISGNFLRHGAKGCFGEGVLAVLQGFFNGTNTAPLAQSSKDAANFGATSGTDLLSGLWFGLAAVMMI